MTYWLFSMRWPVLLLLQPIQVTVLTASLSWVYSIYILVCLLKQKKFIDFQEKLLLRLFCKTKIWLICLLEADFNQEKQISSNQTRVFQLVDPTLKRISSRSLESDVSSSSVYCDWWAQVSKAISGWCASSLPCRKGTDKESSGRDKETITRVEWLLTWMLYNIKLYFVNMYMCIYL